MHGQARNAPSSQDDRTYKEGDENTITNARTSLRRGEVHGHARNAPSSQDDRRTKKAQAHTQMLVRLYDEERCMGTPETLPRHKTAERTKKAQGTHTKALTSL